MSPSSADAPRLEASLALARGPRTLRLPSGAALLVEGPDAAAVVAALAGDDRRAGHRVLLDGRPLHRLGPAGRVRRGLGLVLPGPVAPDVSVRDHLAAVAGRRRTDALLATAPLLAQRGRTPAGVLSGGERRVLAWLRCLVVVPRAVVLDRAGAGLDPSTLRWTGEVVAAWRAAGVALVVRPSRPEEHAWAEPRG